MVVRVHSSALESECGPAVGRVLGEHEVAGSIPVTPTSKAHSHTMKFKSGDIALSGDLEWCVEDAQVAWTPSKGVVPKSYYVQCVRIDAVGTVYREFFKEAVLTKKAVV